MPSNDSKSPLAQRKIAVSAGMGNTAQAIIELLLVKPKYASLTAIVSEDEVEAFKEQFEGVETLIHKTNEILDLGEIDTLMLIPPSSDNKLEITKSLLSAAKQSKKVVNLVLLSSAGADYAENDNQPRLREFIEIERLAMEPKQESETEETGHSPCIIRAGFYAENLLLYGKNVKTDQKLPLPIDKDHKFAPVALGDVALLAATILTSEGEHGLGDNVRGQIITLTGPLMVAGPELAKAASEALGTEIEFVSISADEAKRVLASDQGKDLSDVEKEYLLEYYSLVSEGKTCYCSTLGFEQVTGQPVQGLEDFFKSYAEEFKANGKLSRKRKAAADKGEDAKKGEKNGDAKKGGSNKKQKKNDGEEKEKAGDDDDADFVIDDS